MTQKGRNKKMVYMFESFLFLCVVYPVVVFFLAGIIDQYIMIAELTILLVIAMVISVIVGYFSASSTQKAYFQTALLGGTDRCWRQWFLFSHSEFTLIL
jgi:5-bromo-4-chloroindolyl phosphate hydrolysis protein